MPGTHWESPGLITHCYLVTRLHISVLGAGFTPEAKNVIFYATRLLERCSPNWLFLPHSHGGVKSDHHRPKSRHTWRLFSDILGALNIINGLWLPLSTEICFSPSALATGKQMRQTLCERALGQFTVDPTLSLKDF